MKKLSIIFAVYLAVIISGCTPTLKQIDKVEISNKTEVLPIKSSKKTSSYTKNPISIALYSGKNTPKQPYVILGKETISKFNVAGTKRQEANIKDAMRKLASTLGGDAVINITHDKEKVTGTVISLR